MFPIRAHSVEISGRAERFAVQRIFCVGRIMRNMPRSLAMMNAIRLSFSQNQPMPLCPAALF